MGSCPAAAAAVSPGPPAIPPKPPLRQPRACRGQGVPPPRLAIFEAPYSTLSFPGSRTLPSLNRRPTPCCHHLGPPDPRQIALRRDAVVVSLCLPSPFLLPSLSWRSFDSCPQPYARARFSRRDGLVGKGLIPLPSRPSPPEPPSPQRAPLARSHLAPESRCRAPAAGEARPMARRLCPSVLPCLCSQRPSPSATCVCARSPPHCTQVPARRAVSLGPAHLVTVGLAARSSPSPLVEHPSSLCDVPR
jgi:hypothetical protein